MFLTKGEGIRNILIFGNFGLWLLTLRYRNNLYLLREPVSILFWVSMGVTIFSVIFSIDPLFSFYELKDEPLRAVLLFPVIATVMADEKRLIRAAHVMFFTAILIVSVGYYSYLVHDLPVLKPATSLMTVWHNKFARYLCALLPFAFIPYFLWKQKWLKIFLVISLILSVFALILSTSRGGFIAFISMVCVWTVYLARENGISLIKALTTTAVSILFLGVVSYLLFSPVRERISILPEQLSTINQRTDAWMPGLYAFRENPVFGWGYGERIFHQDEPFQNTPYKKAPITEASKGSGVYIPIGPHNTFLKILFHQGLIGFIPYIILILFAIRDFWRKATAQSKIRNYFLVSCVSVLIGNYILHSMLAVHYIPHLAVILGFGIAATGMNENSNH
ncbi:MAG: O-antigen ligase family protein [Thermodesulfovibrionales bacterium]